MRRPTTMSTELARDSSMACLAAEIDVLGTDDTPVTVAANLRFLRSMSQSTRVLALLDEVLADEVLLGEIAGRSYRHVNHFDKIVLVDGGRSDGYRLTLHLWKPPYTEKELRDELIHDHRFSFWSAVLVGTLRSENFSRSESGAFYHRYQYIPQKSAVTTVSNFYQFTGRAPLEITDRPAKRTGEVYYLWYERIHRVLLPRDGMTCTLVLRGPRRRQHSNVFNTTYPTTSIHAANEMFSPEQLATKLVALSGALRSAGSAGGVRSRWLDRTHGRTGRVVDVEGDSLLHA